jgi:hypothetical protein
MSPPGYWKYETGGALRPAIVHYLNRQVLTDEEIAVIRAYLKQWIEGDFDGVDKLRASVDAIGSRSAIDRWLYQADQLGIDPF